MANIMERFRHMPPEGISEVLQEIVEDDPEDFAGIEVVDLMLLIQDEQYLAAAMTTNICTTTPRTHVWSPTHSEGEACAGCQQPFDRGLICRKCSKKIHFFCYKYTHPCRLPYYHDYSTVSSHLFSDIVVDGFCENCFRQVTQEQIARSCTFCGLIVHIECLRIPRGNRRDLLPLVPALVDNQWFGGINPILVFVNPLSADGRGGALMHQFLEILNPIQIIDIRVTDPESGFHRFATFGCSNVMILGGDRTTNFIMRAFVLMRNQMYDEPTFRFIPLGSMAEIGRSFGGRIHYSTKSAQYLLAQLFRLSTYNFCPWQIYEQAADPEDSRFCETFYYSFALGVETYIDHDAPIPKKPKKSFWSKLTHVSHSLESLMPWRRRNPPEFTQEMTAPVLADYISLEVNGQNVDLTTEPYLAIVLLNRIVREDDFPGRLLQPEVNDAMIDVYGITHYFKLTRKNLVRLGIRLAQSTNVRILVRKNVPFLSDGYSGLIKFTGEGVEREPPDVRCSVLSNTGMREMGCEQWDRFAHGSTWKGMEIQRIPISFVKNKTKLLIRQISPIKVMAVQGEYNHEDRPLMPRGLRENEDDVLDRSECFLENLERRQRRPERLRERQWFIRRLLQRRHADEREAMERREQERRELERREAERREVVERRIEERRQAAIRRVEERREAERREAERREARRREGERREANRREANSRQANSREANRKEAEEKEEERKETERKEEERKKAEKREAAGKKDTEKKAAEEEEEAEKKAAEGEEAKKKAAEEEEAKKKAAEEEEAKKKAAEEEEAKKKAAEKKAKKSKKREEEEKEIFV